jgi:hypothetical protein
MTTHVRPVEHVGPIAVPLTSTKAWFGEHAGEWRSDVMEVEKWPLVQVCVTPQHQPRVFFFK